MRRFVAIAAICFGATVNAAELKLSYASSKWVMGGTPTAQSSVITATDALAFPDMTIAEVAERLSTGYVLGAYQCSNSMVKRMIQTRHVLYCRAPETDELLKIVGVFVFVDDKYTKSLTIELTDGTDGVHVRYGRPQYVSGDNPDFVFAELDGSGGVVYSCDSGKPGKATAGGIGGWNTDGYGACGLSLLKVPSKDAPTLLWSNASGAPVLTLDDIKDCDFAANFCGVSVAANYIGTSVNAYNKMVATNASGQAALIRLEYQMKEGSHLKCAVVELTNGEKGVYGQSTHSLYYTNAAIGYRFINDDGSLNTITGSSIPGYYGQCGTITGANSSSGYGVYALCANAPAPHGKYRSKMQLGADQHIVDPSVLPCVTTTWEKVFDGVSLQEIIDDGYEISAYFCGGSVRNKQRVWVKKFETFTSAGETSVSNAVCVFVLYDDKHTKSATLELETRTDGVYARYVRGQYLYKNNNQNFNFAWLDENGNVVVDCLQESHTATDSNQYPTSWTAGGYAIAGLAASKYMKKNESRLVWANPAGDPVLTLDDIKDCYFGCHFASASISDKNREGMAMYRTFEYDGDSVRSMRVEFQTYDGGWNKCVTVTFTNGVDGVYGCAIAAGHAGQNSGVVGYRFVNANGSYNGYSDNPVTAYNGTGGYGIYDLFAAPMTTLAADTDWSGHDAAVALGGSVVDLNGHRLTVDGLSGDGTIYAKIINTDTAHTAELRCKPAAGLSFNNNSVCLGRSGLTTHKIKFVMDGRGAYAASIAQEYNGGTEVVGGILKAGLWGNSNKPFGTATTQIPVRAGGIFDLNGQIEYNVYQILLDGGTIRNTGTDRSGTSAMLGNVTLSDDASFDFRSSYGIAGDNYAATTLDLAGHILTVDIASGNSKSFALCNTTIKNGFMDLRSGGVLQTGLPAPNGNSNAAVMATDVDFKVNCALWLYAPLYVHDYEAITSYNSNNGTNAVYVCGTFKPSPAHNYFHGCVMQEGSTIDLSERTSALPLVSSFTNENSNRTLAFADGATVYVKCGSFRPTSKIPVISWTPETKPANISSVKFRNADPATKRSFVARSTGLYVVSGFAVLVR